MMNYQAVTLTQKEFRKFSQNKTVSYAYVKTAAGLLKIYVLENMAYKAEFVDTAPELDDTFFSRLKTILLVGTTFQQNVWRAALAIPLGKTISYQDLACQLNHPQAHRAVANALADNDLAYIIPCHRIIRKDGNLGGYKWSTERKIALLQNEKSP